MAITVISPSAGGEYFYAFHNGSGMNTINNVITWTSTTTDTVTISYSVDSGSSWDVIASGVTNTIGTNNYNWSLDAAKYATIFASVDEKTTCQIKVDDGTTNDVSNNDFTIRKVTMGNIAPNYSNNNPTTARIYKDSFVNLVWEELWDSGIGGNVIIEYRQRTGAGAYGSWTTLVASTANDGSYQFVPLDLSMTADRYVQFRITSLTTGHENNIAYSESDDTSTNGWYLSDSYTDLGTVDSFVLSAENFPTRYETFARVSGEKAIWADEFITLSQLVALEGIEIFQYDDDGLDEDGHNRSGTTEKDPFMARNIGIKVKDFADAPRELAGNINFLDAGQVIDVRAPGNYYGRVVKATITHGWNLTNKNDFHLELLQYSSGTLTSEPVPHWEANDVDSIYVYCTIKGNEVDPITGTSVYGQVTAPKDRDVQDTGEYKFRWRLKEIVSA